MKKLMIALALVAAPAAAETGWTYIGENENNSRWYVRTVDFQAGRSWKKDAAAWVKTDDRRNAKVGWNESITLYSIDCTTHTYMSVHTTFYYPGGRNSEIGVQPRAIAVPESIMGSLVDEVCSDPTTRV